MIELRYRLASATRQEALERRAIRECYRVWRERRPWRWLPTGGLFDSLRARAFRRFGRGLRRVFVAAWVREYQVAGGWQTRDLPWGTLDVAVWMDRDEDHPAGEGKTQGSRRGLADPDDALCLEVTERILTPGYLEHVERMMTLMAEARARADEDVSLPDPYGPMLGGLSQRKRVEESHGHRR